MTLEGFRTHGSRVFKVVVVSLVALSAFAIARALVTGNASDEPVEVNPVLEANKDPRRLVP